MSVCTRNGEGVQKLGWAIELVTPAVGQTESKTFEYRLTNIGGTSDLNDVEICLCDTLSFQELKDLLDDCSAVVTYTDESTKDAVCGIQKSQDIVDCNVGLRVRGIPGNGQETQTQIDITMIFKEALPVSPVKVGIKEKGGGADRAEWADICGPGCIEPPTPPTPPSRKIML